MNRWRVQSQRVAVEREGSNLPLSGPVREKTGVDLVDYVVALDFVPAEIRKTGRIGCRTLLDASALQRILGVDLRPARRDKLNGHAAILRVDQQPLSVLSQRKGYVAAFRDTLPRLQLP